MRLVNRIDEVNKDLAIILSKLAYHISPEIIDYIIDKNRKDYAYFAELFKHDIDDIDNYLFDGSACVFPGVRRYTSGNGARQKYNPNYRAIIDDNTFPRHIWCYLINGKRYNDLNWKETGLEEFELAHIFAHKKPKMNNEKGFFKEINENIYPYGEFTCAANVVLLPKGTVHPTDNSPVLKSIFYKRYIDLYGETCLNGRTGFNQEKIPEWYKELKWNTPFLPCDWRINTDELLNYRKKRVKDILDKYRGSGHSA